MRALILITGVVAASGCFVDADYGATRFACTADEPCPDGFACVAGRCERSVADARPSKGADAGTGDDAPDGGPGSSLCGGTIALVDEFEDGATAGIWTAYGGGKARVEETGGVLVVTPAVDQGGLRQAGYRSSARHDLRDSRAFVHVPVMVATSTETSAYLAARADADNLVALVQEGGVLRAEVTSAGATQILAEIAYDAAAHRWWQLREAGGTLHFESSADGASWESRASTPSPALLQSTTIHLGVSTDRAIGAPGVAHFDDVNSHPACRRSSADRR